MAAVQQIGEWLGKLGLGEYEPRFAENYIDEGVLGDLTEADLEKLGIPLGHRKRLLRAIAELGRGDAPAARADAVRPDEAERRQLTLMFCDLVGSTALSVRLDPEELGEIIGRYHQCSAEVITKSGGFVAEYMGDGVLAYFGYPQAHEDDVERAVRAGLALVDAVAALDPAAGEALRVRIGIATGLVVVGDLVGAGAHELAAIGETPNLAARLQALAEPEQVIIDGNTRRLLGSLFEFRALGPVAVSGFREKLPVWQVIGASAVESRFEALRASTTPLVGREEEIDLLLRRWQQAKSGDGCIVLVSGEAGIGKSRIAQTIVERVSGEPHTILRLFCSPHHQDSALYPAITQLERAAGFRREDTPEQRLAKLESVLAQATRRLGEAVPLLAALLSIPTNGRYSPVALSPQKQKEKTLQALVAQVEGLARRQPLLIIVEDAHWGDATSRELFDLLIERVVSLPVLVLVTFRPEFTPPWLGRHQVTLLSLNRLPPRRQAEMIASVTGGKALPPEVAAQIIDRTDGVPLFVEELTKAVIESGALIDAGDRYAIEGPLPPLAIPTTLNASLLARLDRLAPVREVAQVGAAIGRHFSYELIAAVAGIPAQQLDEALAQLVTTELIFARGSPPDAEYTFKHALVQDAAYSTLLRSRRQLLHARIAAVLEKQFPDVVEAQPDLLARHCAEAGLLEKAVGYCLTAGRQAIARWALTEATGQLRKGLDLLAGIPDGTQGQEMELNLQTMLGNVLVATNGYSAPELGESYARARLLCEELKRPPKLATLVGQVTFRMVRGELRQAEQHAEEIRQLGALTTDGRARFVGALLSGSVCSWIGKFREARAHLESCLASWEPRYHAPTSSTEDPYVSMLLEHSRVLVFLGYLDQARSRRIEVLAAARRFSPYTLAYALGQAWIDDWAVDGVKAAQPMLGWAEELMAIAKEQGFPTWSGLGHVMRGWSLAVTGEATEGIPLILRGLAICRSAGHNLGRPCILTMLAEAYAIAGQPEEGVGRLAEAAQLVATTQEGWGEAEVHRLRGTLLLSMQQGAAAEASYREALAVARRQDAKFWELRAALDMARLWCDQGRGEDARELLAPLLGWFTEGVTTPVLRDARTLLERLS
ncbi:MAG TPA: adenylate/guanylate cyclase domain-containing protein [Stellaceae bacterium]|nr:adenylate/guanylate cyclase domain-containing protein [Stellaceae bacterium]